MIALSIYNKTPHDINFMTPNGERTLLPYKNPLRVTNGMPHRIGIDFQYQKYVRALAIMYNEFDSLSLVNPSYKTFQIRGMSGYTVNIYEDNEIIPIHRFIRVIDENYRDNYKKYFNQLLSESLPRRSGCFYIVSTICYAYSPRSDFLRVLAGGRRAREEGRSAIGFVCAKGALKKFNEK